MQPKKPPASCCMAPKEVEVRTHWEVTLCHLVCPRGPCVTGPRCRPAALVTPWFCCMPLGVSPSAPPPRSPPDGERSRLLGPRQSWTARRGGGRLQSSRKLVCRSCRWRPIVDDLVEVDQDVVAEVLHWASTWTAGVRVRQIGEVPCYPGPVGELLQADSGLQTDDVRIPCPR
jgi:hypothetical protein